MVINSNTKVEPRTGAGGSSDHSTLSNLGADDHTQYTYFTTGTGDPTGSVTPQRVGHIYVATDLSNAWIATDTGSSNWEQIDAAGGGGGGNTWDDLVSSNIVPDTDITYDLGSAAARFDTAYVSSLSVVSSNLEASATFMQRIGDSTYFSIQHAQDLFHSTGQTTGGEIVSGSTTGVNVSAGTGLIRSGDDSTLPLNWFDWSASAGVPVPTDTTRYIGIEYNGGSPQITTRTSYNWNNEDDFSLGIVVNEGGELYIEVAPFKVADHAGLMIERLYETMPLRRDERLDVGLILGETGTRNITMTAGALWDKLNRFALAAIDTSGSDTFDRYYTNGAGGWNKQTGQTQWDNTQYDNAGTLTTLATNKWATQYFYVTIDDKLISIYGQTEHNSEAQAEAESPPASVPDRLKEGTLIGRIIFKESDATATKIESAFGTVFAGAQVTDHGFLAGLEDDDHTQYLRTDGTRTIAGNFLPDGDGTRNLGEDATRFGTVYTDALEVTNNIVVGGNVDGRDVSVDGTKLDNMSVSSSSDVDHNATTNYVANEHIDWTADQGATNINNANIDSSLIDHDNLTNFVANEHIDWTADQGATNINNANIDSSLIDHDNLTNFVANEHIDWTADQGATNINNANIDSSLIDHDNLTNFVANEHIDWTADQGATNINNANIDSSLIDHDNLTNFVANEHIDWTVSGADKVDIGNLSAVPSYLIVDFVMSPAAESFTITTGDKLIVSNGGVQRVDLRYYDEARFSVVRGGTGDFTTLEMGIRYNTTFNATYNQFSALGDGPVDVSCTPLTSSQVYDSGWINIRSEAKADDITLGCYQKDANTQQSASFVRCSLELRRTGG